MRRATIALLAIAFAAGAAAKGDEAKVAERLEECHVVLKEVMGVPEGVPRDLLDKAECVAVIPGVKKAALGIGGRWGKGAAVCRTEAGAGAWGSPLMISIGGGSFGLQIGAQSSDYVFLIMNPRGINYLLKSKFTLGADASVAAGPKGRSLEAATDAQMRAEILTYSRSRGVFAGISLEGAVVKQDKDSNVALYGARRAPKELLLKSGQKIPSEAQVLVELLQTMSPRNKSGQ
jgi:lipid-binding SYLF domain-containing protein